MGTKWVRVPEKWGPKKGLNAQPLKDPWGTKGNQMEVSLKARSKECHKGWKRLNL